MPCKQHATKSQLQNLQKIKKKIFEENYYKFWFVIPWIQIFEPLLPQMAVFDEPNMMDADNIPTVPNEVNSDSEDSIVEILDAGSDVNIYEETEIENFSRMLFDAQKRA